MITANEELLNIEYTQELFNYFDNLEELEDLIDSVLQLEIRRQQDVPLSEYIDILNEHTREADEDEEKEILQDIEVAE